jgi:hypothetical protein
MTMDVIMRATPGKREIHQGGVEVTRPPRLSRPTTGSEAEVIVADPNVAPMYGPPRRKVAIGAGD